MTRQEKNWEKEKYVLNDINTYRKSLSKDTLSWCNICAHYAEEHSLNMAEKKVPFSHQGINERLEKIKKEFKYSVGSENVAMSKPDSDPVKMWKKSAGHNKNMLGVWTHCGIGHVERNGFNYYTAIFVRAI